MTARRVVALLVLALAAYFVLIGYRGVFLLSHPDLSLKVFGAAVLALPMIGVWVVVAELRFGAATQRLGRMLDATGTPSDPQLPRLPSGRVDRIAADALFAQRRAAVESAPGDWRGWYQLAVAYDLAGDRPRARAAMREAIDRAHG
ncbi:MAG: hypothetical protein ABJB98_08415 [Actinomycetota bacterium]